MIPFWLVWGGLFAIKAFRAGSFFYAGKPLMLLLSLVASDGYWQSPYYEIGEWFLGALVILYFIYPFILFALKRRPLLTTVFMFAGYLIGLHIQIGGWDIPFRGIFTCGLSFFLGMLLSKEYTSILREKRVWGIVTGFLSLHFYTNIPPLPLDSVTYCILTGTVIFVFLLILGNEITTHAGALKILQKAASISYEVFLVHHVIYYSLEPFFESFVHKSSMNVNLAVTVALFLYLLAVIPAAILLHCISRYILNAFSLEKRKTGTNQNENQNLMKY